jgi:hypothetical protein
MSAYNTLVVNTKCCNCNEETRTRIQFRYGDTWDYEYQIGEDIRWGGNDIGNRNARRVVLDGASEPCKICDKVMDYLIFIENNVIKSVEKNYGQYNFTSSEDYYFIIE